MDNDKQHLVSIVDIKMPFWSIVVFMVKAAIASIPAILILTVIGAIITVVLGGMFGGMRHY